MNMRISATFVLLIILASGTAAEPADYRQDMRDFVQEISLYARSGSSDFIIISQNGQELISLNGEPDGNLATDYIKAIDGSGREDLFYGYNRDDTATPADEHDYMIRLCDLFTSSGLQVLVTDYCSTESRIHDSYSGNEAAGFISFAAPERDLNIIPDYPAQPWNAGADDVVSLSEAANFLYLINYENFSSRQQMIDAVSATDYDLLILDLFFNDEVLTENDLELLKQKNNGGRRLVICYMSIGEAEEYRYYWNSDWESSPPGWLDDENPNWPGNYKVRYWNDEWKSIIYGSSSSYTGLILQAGFDGVYLDIIDAFEYYES